MVYDVDVDDSPYGLDAIYTHSHRSNQSLESPALDFLRHQPDLYSKLDGIYMPFMVASLELIDNLITRGWLELA